MPIPSSELSTRIVARRMPYVTSRTIAPGVAMSAPTRPAFCASTSALPIDVEQGQRVLDVDQARRPADTSAHVRRRAQRVLPVVPREAEMHRHGGAGTAILLRQVDHHARQVPQACEKRAADPIAVECGVDHDATERGPLSRDAWLPGGGTFFPPDHLDPDPGDCAVRRSAG